MFKRRQNPLKRRQNVAKCRQPCLRYCASAGKGRRIIVDNIYIFLLSFFRIKESKRGGVLSTFIGEAIQGGGLMRRHLMSTFYLRCLRLIKNCFVNNDLESTSKGCKIQYVDKKRGAA